MIRLNSESYVWLVNYNEAFLDAVDNISLVGDTLRVTGSAFVNEDLDPALMPVSPLTGIALDPFTLVATCDL